MKRFKTIISLIITICILSSVVTVGTVFAESTDDEIKPLPKFDTETIKCYFYLPDIWKADENFVTFVAFWDKKSQFYEYLMNETETKNVYSADIPKDIENMMLGSFNKYDRRSSYHCTPMYDTVPDDNMIYVIDPEPEVTDFGNTYGGDWFYYYNENGTYGAFKTYEESFEKGQLLSNGEYISPLKYNSDGTVTNINDLVEKAPAKLKGRYPKINNLEVVNLGSVDKYNLYFTLTRKNIGYSNYNIYINDYIFNTRDEQYPYDLGLFLVNDDIAYNLDEAVYYGDVDISKVVKLIKDAKYLKFGFNVQKCDSLEKIFIDYLFGNNSYIPVLGTDPTYKTRQLYEYCYEYKKIGEANGCSIVYGYNLKKPITGSSITFGDYEIFNKASENAGLYIIQYGEVIPLKEAYDKGIITDTEGVVQQLADNKKDIYFKISKNGTVITTEPEKKTKFLVECNIGEHIKYDGLYEVSENFSATLTVDNGYYIDSLTAKMGNTEIYTENYNNFTYMFLQNGIINGDIVITATAKSLNNPEEIKKKYPNTFLNLVEYGSTDNYTLYYNIYKGYYSEMYYDIDFGDYIFTSYAQQSPDDIGLFVVSDGSAYTLKEAYDKGIVNMDTIYDMLKPHLPFYGFDVTLKKDLTSTTETTTTTTTATIPTTTKPVVKTPKINTTKYSANAGTERKLTVTDGSVKCWNSSNKKVATVKNGKVTSLSKGTANITATLTNGKKLTCNVTVKTSPKLSKSSVTIKKGKTATITISGKAGSISNKYYNTKYAKIISKANDKKLKVKGLKKGTTTLKIKVNGVKTLKLKVKIK